MRFHLHFIAFISLASPLAHVAAASTPEEVLAGFDQRVEAMFRAESGERLRRAKKQPPLSPGRGNYVRGYSYSLVGFAARCLYLDEMNAEANAALVENAQHYIENPLDINDRDSFHWHAEIVLRLIEMYGTNGTVYPGRITKDTERIALQPIWTYTKMSSWLSKTEVEKSKTWHVYSSENHHAMDFTICWHFSKLAKDLPEYRDLQYDSGGTPAEHHEAWSDFFVAYCRERARKGPCVEMMSGGYNSTLIKGFYNFYDFGSPRVRHSAGMLLDLYFAYWAQEQIDGVSGGGKSRIYFDKGLTHDRSHGMAPLAWYYFGIGRRPSVNGHDMNAALSSYRPPAVVADIALDVVGRGCYEVRQRAQGRGVQGRTDPQVTIASKYPSRLSTNGGGIIRYSYCHPAFILGTPMTEARPLSDWVHISAQNRWQGCIFAGEEYARIVPIVRPRDSWRALNAQWSVQRKGCLITQKLKYHKNAAEMLVWMSQEGLTGFIEEDGVVFVEAPGAYAAVRVSHGGYKWSDSSFTAQGKIGSRRVRPGRVLVPSEEFAAVILEVAAQDHFGGFDAFKGKVLATRPKMDGKVLKYESIYGDRFTFDTGFRQQPTINGKVVDYQPKKVLESPFVNADYNSGVVTITKGSRRKVLDFNSEVP